jgi:hypothetical protein
MTTESTVGLGWSSAVQEALAEETAETVDTEASFSDEVTDDSEAEAIDEQPIVESEDNFGLFDNLVEEVDDVNKKEKDQPLDVESLTIEVNGEMKTINDLKEGYMRQADYTRKTQELATQRDELDKAKTLWDALQNSPYETVKQLWSRVSAGQPVATSEPQQTQVTDLDALVEQKLQERLANDPRLRSLEEQDALGRINQVFTMIESERSVQLSDADKEKVLERAQDLGVSDLLFVFDGMMHQKQVMEAQRANVAKTATVTSIRSATPSDSEPTLPARPSWREAQADTLRQENVLDTQFTF